MAENVDWNQLARYITGEVTEAERAQVARWVRGHQDRQELLATLVAQWQSADGRATHDVDAAWARLSARLPHVRSTQASDEMDIGRLQPNVGLMPRRARRWMGALRALPLAAAVVFAIGLGVVWYARDVSHQPATGAPTALAGTRVATRAGERRTIELPDGSSIVVGAASAVRLDDAFGRDERQVYLEGQALFRVRHDTRHPFVVHAGGTVSRDLGTEFEVRAFAGDSAVRVIVAEGSVSVRPEGVAQDLAATLGPRDVAKVGVSGSPVVLHDQNVDRLLAWTKGEIGFDNATLSDVTQELERWYDIECRIADPSLASLHLTNTGLPLDSLDEALQLIELSLDVHAERAAGGRVVTFTRRVRGASEIPPARSPRDAEPGG